MRERLSTLIESLKHSLGEGAKLKAFCDLIALKLVPYFSPNLNNDLTPEKDSGTMNQRRKTKKDGGGGS